MCGIAGIIKLKEHPLHLPSALKGMTDLIRHRGPDGEGFFFSSASGSAAAGGNETPQEIYESSYPWSPSARIESIAHPHDIALGHRRLSIIDLSPAGHQPMCDTEKKLWLVYNGEIYNYIEIREELKKLGHHFITGTDTEVLINTYRQWGTDCVKRFNGMWSFVLYDRGRNILFGSRDRFGVKPFYYYRDEHLFAFASEQKALVKQPFVKTGINDKAVVDFFVKSEIEYEAEGMFKNIFELFPSHSFTLDLNSGKLETNRYYSLPVNEAYEKFDEKKLRSATEEVRELLVNAVSLRLRSDVTVGSCLSGGVDSSTIVGIINHLLSKDNSIHIGERLKVFTASFSNAAIDESKWAAQVVERTGADWKRTFPNAQELLKDIQQLIYCQDVPIWSTSTYAQYRVMQLAKENGVKVVLDGQGGDELFAGYDPYYLHFWKEVAAHSGTGAALQEMRSYDSLPRSLRFMVKENMKQRVLPRVPASVQRGLQQYYFDELAYLDKGLLERQKTRLTFPNHREARTLNGMLYSEFYNTRLKGYLKCEDRCSMWHSVESRTPFSDDHLLIEYVFGLPAVYKIHNGINKYVLREAAAPFIPEGVKNRRDKMGYVTPTRQWISEIRDELKDLFDKDLEGYLDVRKIHTDFDKLFDQPNLPDNGRIFKLISFALWHRSFFR